jgi:hypothetical protein
MTFRGHPIEVVLAFVLTGIAVLLWLPYRSQSRWPLSAKVFLGLLLVLWITSIALSAYHDNLWLWSAWILPVFLLMLFWKRPTSRSVSVSIDIFAISLVALSLLDFALKRFDLFLQSSGSLNTPEGVPEGYWLPISDLVGIPGRFTGALGHPNVSAPIGIFLVLYGLHCLGVRRYIFFCVGILLLFLTGSRTSLFATLTGVIVWFAFSRYFPVDQRSRPFRKIAVLTAVGISAFLYLLVFGQGFSFTGRSSIWPTYWDLTLTAPLTGVGDPGVARLVYLGQLPDWAGHAHNTILDWSTRYGLLVGMLLIGIWLTAFVIVMRAAKKRQSFGLALWTSLVIVGMFESPFDWRFLNVPMTMLLWGVLLSLNEESTSSTQKIRISGITTQWRNARFQSRDEGNEK